MDCRRPGIGILGMVVQVFYKIRSMFLKNEGEFEVCLTVTNDCGQSIKCSKLLIGISATLSLASYELEHVSCFEGNDGSIKINVQGGVPPYSYSWNNNSKSKDQFQLIAGNYL